MVKTTIAKLFIFASAASITLILFTAKTRLNILSYFTSPTLTAAEGNKVNNLVLDDNGRKTELFMNQGFWYVKSSGRVYRAMQEKVSALLTSIGSIKKEEIATTDPSRYALFGIGPRRITVTSPQDTFTVFVGFTANLTGNYLRINRESEVFAGEGFAEAFRPQSYIDFSVHLVEDEAAVSAINIRNGGNDFKLQYGNGGWYCNGKEVAKEKASFFINDLKTFSAEETVSDLDVLPDPPVTIEVEEGDRKKAAEFYPQGNHTLVKTGNGSFYKISTETGETLLAAVSNPEMCASRQ